MKRLTSFFLIGIVLTLAGCMGGSEGNKTLWEQSTLYKVMKTKKLRVCTDPGYEPFEIRNKKNDVVGFDIDIARAMADSIKVELVIVPAAFDGIIPALLTDKCDIIMAGMTINPERNLQVNFPSPYMQIGQTILLNKKHRNKIHNYTDLNDPKYTVVSRLGVTGGFVAKQRLPKANIKLYETENEAILEVVSGKADAFIYDYPLCASYYLEYKDALVFLDKPFTYEPLAFAIRKGDPDFLNWIENFMLQYKGSGEYEKSLNYWFKNNEWKKSIRG